MSDEAGPEHRRGFGAVRKTRVLLIAPVGSGVGGILSQSNELVRMLRDAGSIDLCVIDSTQRYRDYDDLRASRRAIGGMRQAVRIAAWLVVTAARFRPDVVHVRSSASLGLIRDLVLLGLARLFRARRYIQLHFGRIPDLEARRNWEWGLLIAASRAADGVCVLDSRSKAALEKHLPQGRVRLIPNGVDCAWVDDIVADLSARRGGCGRPKIVYTGVVLPAKGVVELAEACTRIAAVEFELELVGPVGFRVRKQLEQIAARRDGGDWLTFTGAVPREEAVRRVAAADVFVLPSYTEGFPLSLLEAMACGVAVLASDVGAVPEILAQENGERPGMVVPPRDAVALQAALETLLTDPARRRALGSAARKRCETRYPFAEVVARLEALWST